MKNTPYFYDVSFLVYFVLSIADIDFIFRSWYLFCPYPYSSKLLNVLISVQATDNICFDIRAFWICTYWVIPTIYCCTVKRKTDTLSISLSEVCPIVYIKLRLRLFRGFCLFGFLLFGFFFLLRGKSRLRLRRFLFSRFAVCWRVFVLRFLLFRLFCRLVDLFSIIRFRSFRLCRYCRCTRFSDVLRILCFFLSWSFRSLTLSGFCYISFKRFFGCFFKLSEKEEMGTSVALSSSGDGASL